MKQDSFKDFILEQLEDLGDIRCRAMFGGHGIYYGDIFFGIIFKGSLYFKTSDRTRADYIRLGMKPFRPSKDQTLITYYEVPADILEENSELLEWAGKAIASQKEATGKKKREKQGEE
jgi:DNA transformation protein